MGALTKEKLWAEILRQTPNLEKDGVPGEKVRKLFDLVYNHAYEEGVRNGAKASPGRRKGEFEFMESVLDMFTAESSRKRWPGTGR